MIIRLQSDLDAHVMITSPLVSESISIVQIDSGANFMILALSAKRNGDRGTYRRTCEECFAVEEQRSSLVDVRLSTSGDVLECIAGTDHEDVSETVFQTE